MTQWRKIQKVHICDYVSVHASSLKAHLKTHLSEKILFVVNVTLHPFSRALKTTFENSHFGKGIQMRPMWFCSCTNRKPEETLENTYKRKTSQVQSLHHGIFSFR